MGGLSFLLKLQIQTFTFSSISCYYFHGNLDYFKKNWKIQQNLSIVSKKDHIFIYYFEFHKKDVINTKTYNPKTHQFM